jgi:hypothetical protein
VSDKKFKKGTIKVATKRGTKVDADAYILGTLAITRALTSEVRRADGGTGDYEEVFTANGEAWVVTHVPTGWGVMTSIPKKPQAEVLARALEDLIPADENLMNGGWLNEDWYKRATEVVKAWKAGLKR